MGGPKIFVGGLPKVVTEVEIREFFGNFGSVVDVKMMYNDTMESKGYCFVTFAETASVQAVFDIYDNNMIGGKWVDCKSAVEVTGSGGGKKQVQGKPGDWTC